jgi:hypothetical protein
VLLTYYHQSIQRSDAVSPRDAIRQPHNQGALQLSDGNNDTGPALAPGVLPRNKVLIEVRRTSLLTKAIQRRQNDAICMVGVDIPWLVRPVHSKGANV